jgi:hypothetical protein
MARRTHGVAGDMARIAHHGTCTGDKLLTVSRVEHALERAFKVQNSVVDE